MDYRCATRTDCIITGSEDVEIVTDWKSEWSIHRFSISDIIRCTGFIRDSLDTCSLLIIVAEGSKQDIKQANLGAISMFRRGAFRSMTIDDYPCFTAC